MPKSNIILMADIIGSSSQPQAALMADFEQIIGDLRETTKPKFHSPPTITLGDEFQAIPRDLPAALEVVLQIEESIIHAGAGFKLRYVVLEGDIETPINRKLAHGMMGPGLTEARERLEEGKKPGTSRFQFFLQDHRKSMALRDTFIALQHIVDGWRVEKDFAMVAQFLAHEDYKIVAEKIHKDRSQVYKRGRSLAMEAYLALKSVIRYIGSSS